MERSYDSHLRSILSVKFILGLRIICWRNKVCFQNSIFLKQSLFSVKSKVLGSSRIKLTFSVSDLRFWSYCLRIFNNLFLKFVGNMLKKLFVNEYIYFVYPFFFQNMFVFLQYFLIYL